MKLPNGHFSAVLGNHIYIPIHIHFYPQKNCSQPKLLNTLNTFYIHMTPIRTLKWGLVITGSALWLGLVTVVLLVLIGG